jgi:hypothetical protein
MDDVLQKRSVEYGGRLEFLAGDGGSNDGEDARTDNRANAKRSQAQPAQGFFQPEFGSFAIGNQFVDTFAAKER